MGGELSVLNCGKGDIRIKLDKDSPIEVLKAKRMIQDMLKRGYLLAIEGKDGKLIPVDHFDAEAGEYIVCEGALYSVTLYGEDGTVIRSYSANNLSTSYPGGRCDFTDMETGKKVTISGTIVVEQK